MLRACARKRASAGQAPGARSATYSQMASDSQTLSSPSRSTGTLPAGATRASAAPESGWNRAMRVSMNGIASVRSRNQGRNDHEE